MPGDHLGIFPGNNEDLVTTLIDKLEDAPPVNQIVKVEFLEERNTALGNTNIYVIIKIRECENYFEKSGLSNDILGTQWFQKGEDNKMWDVTGFYEDI